MKRSICALLMTLIMPTTPMAAGLEHDRVIAIHRDTTLMLAHAGDTCLADLVFPNAALAQSWLAEHMLQHEISFIALDEDRYGCRRVHTELEQRLLQEGVAVMYAQAAMPDDWVAAETGARQAKRGIWAQPDWVLTPENAAQHLFEFHPVEGTVTRVYRGKTATYVNFGKQWQEDFSVVIAGRDRRQFDALLTKVQPGRRLRVRGTIYPENGPMIRLIRPEQLELI